MSWRNGVEGFRLILVGIGLNALLVAVTEWILVSADLNDVARANLWLNGSLEEVDWLDAGPVLLAVVCGAAVIVVAAFGLSALMLGDDAATALGERVRMSQAVLLLTSVGLAAISVAAVGPIGFVAFVAPQLAVRLVRTPRPPLVASALMGAVMLVGSDLAARTLLPGDLPVGVVTTAIGGPFLMYLIIRANRRFGR